MDSKAPPNIPILIVEKINKVNQSFEKLNIIAMDLNERKER
jgi:hypothetical protein